MTLTLYNTLTRRKEPFRPIDARNVRMYVCGPTVYDYAHIGNARPVIVFDVLYRLLRHLYGAEHVTYVRNITDVEDKINARAAEEGVSIGELTERTTRQFHADIAALGVLPPTFEPRATDYIRRSDNALDMVRLIETLVRRGHAYVADDHVLFDVSSMPDYGRLANRSLEEMEAGARVEVAPYKKGPMDFVLWKPSKPGEPAWPSPAGIATPGRPGWHIECSAMAGALLGETFDIHGGGIDLVFPHHENEIAQSRCAHGTPVMANYWLHNGFLQVEGEKMSKSLGNFVTINELLRGWKIGPVPGTVVRTAMLMTHYREPIDWTVERVLLARSLIDRWNRLISLSDTDREEWSFDPRKIDPEVLEALLDDINTPLAIGRMTDRFGYDALKKPSEVEALVATMQFMGLLHSKSLYFSGWPVTGTNWPRDLAQQIGAIGFDYRIAVSNFDAELKKECVARLGELRCSVEDRGFRDVSIAYSPAIEQASPTVEELLSERHAARKAKNFKEADRIRDELSAMGIQLKDAKDPKTGEIVTTWEVKR